MTKHTLVAFTILLGLPSTHAQVAPGIQWQRCLAGSFKDFGYAVQQIPSSEVGGYVVAGVVASNDGEVSGGLGGGDAWVVKLDDMVNLIWQKPLGGTGYDCAYAVRPTTDGGYFVAGKTTSYDGDVSGQHGFGDAWVVKLDDMGNILWQRALGGGALDEATAIQQTTDGGYVVAGFTQSNDGDVSGHHGSMDAWVVRLDDSGSIIWQKPLGGSDMDQAYAVQQTTDGGYVVAGIARSSDGDVSGIHGNDDAWVVKLDASGNLTWQKALGGSSADRGHAVQQTTDGGYVVAGASTSNDGDVTGNHGAWDAWVVKLDDTGNITWQKSLGGSGPDLAYAVQQTTDGGYVVSGEVASTNDGDVFGGHGSFDAWVVKLDNAGNLTWQKPLGGSHEEDSQAIHQTTDGGYVVAGTTHSNDGDVSGNHGLTDLWVVKLDNEGVGLEEPAIGSFSLGPNPSPGLVCISTSRLWRDAQLTLTDVLGREVLRENIAGSSATLDLTSWPRGLYLLAIRSEEGTSSERLVLE